MAFTAVHAASPPRCTGPSPPRSNPVATPMPSSASPSGFRSATRMTSGDVGDSSLGYSGISTPERLTGMPSRAPPTSAPPPRYGESVSADRCLVCGVAPATVVCCDCPRSAALQCVACAEREHASRILGTAKHHRRALRVGDSVVLPPDQAGPGDHWDYAKAALGQLTRMQPPTSPGCAGDSFAFIRKAVAAVAARSGFGAELFSKSELDSGVGLDEGARVDFLVRWLSLAQRCLGKSLACDLHEVARGTRPAAGALVLQHGIQAARCTSAADARAHAGDVLREHPRGTYARCGLPAPSCACKCQPEVSGGVAALVAEHAADRRRMVCFAESYLEITAAHFSAVAAAAAGHRSETLMLEAERDAAADGSRALGVVCATLQHRAADADGERDAAIVERDRKSTQIAALRAEHDKAIAEVREAHRLCSEQLGSTLEELKRTQGVLDGERAAMAAVQAEKAEGEREREQLLRERLAERSEADIRAAALRDQIALMIEAEKLAGAHIDGAAAVAAAEAGDRERVAVAVAEDRCQMLLAEQVEASRRFADRCVEVCCGTEEHTRADIEKEEKVVRQELDESCSDGCSEARKQMSHRTVELLAMAAEAAERERQSVIEAHESLLGLPAPLLVALAASERKRRHALGQRDAVATAAAELSPVSVAAAREALPLRSPLRCDDVGTVQFQRRREEDVSVLLGALLGGSDGLAGSRRAGTPTPAADAGFESDSCMTAISRGVLCEDLRVSGEGGPQVSAFVAALVQRHRCAVAVNAQAQQRRSLADGEFQERGGVERAELASRGGLLKDLGNTAMASWQRQWHRAVLLQRRRLTMQSEDEARMVPGFSSDYQPLSEWVEYTTQDGADDRRYYYNTRTLSTQWEPPEGVPQDLIYSVPRVPPGAPPPQLCDSTELALPPDAHRLRAPRMPAVAPPPPSRIARDDGPRPPEDPPPQGGPPLSRRTGSTKRTAGDPRSLRDIAAERVGAWTRQQQQQMGVRAHGNARVAQIRSLANGIQSGDVPEGILRALAESLELSSPDEAALPAEPPAAAAEAPASPCG
eukprot:TRINITY_DN30862_c0_g1_i1.p1 TRINITY_DN30862_c0_g1~~TRINITY_DN30862_c0_g1_i1.p1  ORF type:complete len:1049 (+),score=332.85 TRINITY_DN30862_c0_g1_i1:57-3203(+)